MRDAIFVLPALFRKSSLSVHDFIKMLLIMASMGSILLIQVDFFILPLWMGKSIGHIPLLHIQYLMTRLEFH